MHYRFVRSPFCRTPHVSADEIALADGLVRVGRASVQDALGPTTTHAVVDPHDDLSSLPNAERVKLVSPEWLQDTLAAGAVRPPDAIAVVCNIATQLKSQLQLFRSP